MTDSDDIEKALARQKSYIGPAVITLILYWLFYVPGLIVNILYMKDAKRIARIAGQNPSGYGCLVVLFALGIVPFLISIFLIFTIFITESSSIAPLIYSIF